MTPACLTDDEIDAICAGLRQSAAMVRYLGTVLKVPVQRKPNGTAPSLQTHPGDELLQGGFVRSQSFNSLTTFDCQARTL